MVDKDKMNADFTYCNGYACPLRGMCKRYYDFSSGSKSGHWMVVADYDVATGNCRNFINKN